MLYEVTRIEVQWKFGVVRGFDVRLGVRWLCIRWINGRW